MLQDAGGCRKCCNQTCCKADAGGRWVGHVTGGLEKCCNETCRVDGLRCNGGGAVAMTDGMLQEEVDVAMAGGMMQEVAMMDRLCCNSGQDVAKRRWTQGCNMDQ